MDKVTLRKNANLSGIMSEEEYNSKSDTISELAATIREVSGALSVFVYLSTKSEPQTDKLIKRFIEEGKKVYVPVVDGEEFYLTEYASNIPVKAGAFGIREPACPVRTNVVPEVALIPMVSFDKSLTRLGHGKGYYDRYLAGKEIYKVGLCFAARESDCIPRDGKDIPMDVIVTDRGIIK